MSTIIHCRIPRSASALQLTEAEVDMLFEALGVAKRELWAPEKQELLNSIRRSLRRAEAHIKKGTP
jgi:hypothetical protein